MGRLVLILGLVAAALAGGFVYWKSLPAPPPQIAGTRAITLPDGKVLNGRFYYREADNAAAPKDLVWEVELPGGKWIECGGNCIQAAQGALK